MIYAGAVLTRQANDAAALHHEQHQIKQSNKTTNAQSEPEDITSRAVAFGATVAAIFQCYVYAKQLSVARTQAKIMDRQAGVAEQQTALMERQLKATEISAEASRVASQAALATIDRPYLHVISLNYTTLKLVGVSGQNTYVTTNINVCVKNAGQSPAVILATKYTFAIRNKFRTNFVFVRDTSTSYHRGAELILNGESAVTAGHLCGTLNIRDESKNWLHFGYYVIGQIEYLDPIRLDRRVRGFLYHMPQGPNSGTAIYNPAYDYDRIQELSNDPTKHSNITLPSQ